MRRRARPARAFALLGLLLALSGCALLAKDPSESPKAELATYEEQTRPLIAYYRDSSLLHTVDGSGETEDIYTEIEAIVKS